MILAGVRLGLYKLHDELVVPLLSFSKGVDEQEWEEKSQGDIEIP